MSAQLTLDEMLECLTVLNHPAAGCFKAVMEAIGTVMAQALAERLAVRAGSATFQGLALAGTCAPFRPAFPGQPCPSPLASFDPDGWPEASMSRAPVDVRSGMDGAPLRSRCA